MERNTHLLFAVVLFLLCNFIFHLPIYASVFALIGALIPDLDIKIKILHRKLFHNIWFLSLINIIMLQAHLFDRMVAIAFSIGFLSHLISDSMTHMGVMPLWPIRQPHFRGPVKTGSTSELLVLAGLILFIFVFGNLLI